jgi:geranylgeranyl diphosphate synthase, type I
MVANSVNKPYTNLLQGSSEVEGPMSIFHQHAPPTVPTPLQKEWLDSVRTGIDRLLLEHLKLPDERTLDPRWREALAHLQTYTCRPAKRLRPALMLAGYGLTEPRGELPSALWTFATGIELLHTFMLIHDDVADRAASRRGEASLHHVLGEGRIGEDLAVVAGDHLFARAIEVMLSARFVAAPKTVQYYLRVCRHTAVGQYLDLDLSRLPLSKVTLFQALKVAQLKTARYGFVAPLVAGAHLANASKKQIAIFERIGRNLGLAYQVQDDIIGLFGRSEEMGKPVESDYLEGKRTFPVVAAYVRAPQAVREEMDKLWPTGGGAAAGFDRARELIEVHGGRAAAERLVQRATRAARQALSQLDESRGMREFLDALIAGLAHRRA